MELKYIVRLLISPGYWFPLRPYSEIWDTKLNELMERNKFTNCDGYFAELGKSRIWIENHPYASFEDRDRNFRPSIFTLMKARDKLLTDIPGLSWKWVFLPEWQKNICDKIKFSAIENWIDEFIEEDNLISKFKKEPIKQDNADLPTAGPSEGYVVLPLENFPNCCGKCKNMKFDIDLVFCKLIKRGQTVSIFGKCKKFRTNQNI